LDAEPLRYDGAGWRRLAAWGSREGPAWFVRWSPPVIGLAACALLHEERHNVQRNLTRVRGPVAPWRDALEVARTFAAYAGAFAESLTHGSKNAGDASALVHGAPHFERALAAGKGIVCATAHTGGWDVVGKLLTRELGVRMTMVMRRERDGDAAAVHDAARARGGYEVLHVGAHPLDALPLTRALAEGRMLGVQIDRVPAGARARRVTLFGEDARLPEGPIRLAQLTGAPLVPAFCARVGYRRYVVRVSPPLYVPRRAAEHELDAVAQYLADAFAASVQEHPTQWHDFGRAF